MISLKNITVRGGRKLLLDNINADFSITDCLVITGSSGSGKSVPGKVIGRFMEPEKRK
jgi:ABC-type transporter Mla maintaining outer membrane lipid asymmetry ATPase subunit MlaF